MFSKLLSRLRRKKPSMTTNGANTTSTSTTTAAAAMAPPAIPETTTAIVIKPERKAAIETVPVPKPRAGHVLIKVAAVALNPTDRAHIDFPFGGPKVVGSRSGCDCAGTVVALGEGVTRYKVGDRIGAFAHGGNGANHDDGGFAGYATVSSDISFHVPESISLEAASTVSLGATTVGQGLYQALKLPLPTEPAKDGPAILIWGGATATGILGVQFAKLSGYRVLATSSPKNFEYLKEIGAAEVFDYNSPTVVEDIKKAAGGAVSKAWDCIAKPETATACAKCFGPEGGDYRSLLKVEDDVVKGVNDKVTNGLTLAYTAFGEAFEKFMPFSPNREDFDFGRMFLLLTEKLLVEGKLVPARQFVNRGGKGLEGVLNGIDELRKGNVSGGKLVYTLE
jgi:NADPH:quinone reductase-like Zn-dependent oxidoreductase